MSGRPVVVIAGCEMPIDLAIERERLAPAGIELVDGRALSPSALADALLRASGLLTEGFMPLDGPALGRMPRCAVVGFYSIGVEKIDLEAASALGMIVTNAPGYCTDEVADHAMLLLLAVQRKLRPATRIAASPSWNIEALRPVDRLRGRTLGLVGYGAISRAVAERARAFGMAIAAYDPFVAPQGARPDVTMLALDALFAASDAVSIHIPLTDATRGLVGRHQLGLLRPGAVLVNTSRGGVIDEAALIDSLESGRLAGAGLDVLASEPATSASSRRLIELDAVVCTPHMAYYSEDALCTLRMTATNAVAEVLAGGHPDARHWINRARWLAHRERRTAAQS